MKLTLFCLFVMFELVILGLRFEQYSPVELGGGTTLNGSGVYRDLSKDMSFLPSSMPPAQLNYQDYKDLEVNYE